ncbi:MAG: glycosyltransferase [Bacteroidota bacterium]|nr:glycosyltransferase [Bacteroidota bacterium]
MMKQRIICMLSSRHSAEDDRIYWKESLSLVNAGYELVHICLGAEARDIRSRHGVREITLPKLSKDRELFLSRLLRIAGRDRKLLRQFAERAAAIKADAYHIHDLQLLKLVPVLKKLEWSPAIIYDVHESYADLIRDHAKAQVKWLFYPLSWYTSWWEAKCAKQCNVIIAAEPNVCERFRRITKGIPCNTLFNYSYFLPGEREQPAVPKKYDAIYSGTIHSTRGVWQVVTAVKILKRSLPGIKVLLVGSFASPGLEQALRDFISVKELQEQLIIHPTVPYEDMPAFYRQSCVGLCLVHPLPLYHNAIFIKTFEYMAFGLPVLASNFGTVAKVITETGAGICVDPLDPEKIANALEELLKEKDLYANCSRSGESAVTNQYNWKSQESLLLNIYSKLLP